MMEKLLRDGGRARECECQRWRERKGSCVSGGGESESLSCMKEKLEKTEIVEWRPGLERRKIKGENTHCEY